MLVLVGRVLDLTRAGFSALSPLSEGVVPVKITGPLEKRLYPYWNGKRVVLRKEP
jgi:rare lipoprotein A (peptidoglycan hydrolase)